LTNLRGDLTIHCGAGTRAGTRAYGYYGRNKLNNQPPVSLVDAM
jgi:hypothetical protein